MRNLIRFTVFILIMGAMSCKTESPKQKAIELADLDTTVSPVTDFDNYANGGWKKRFPIPDEKSRFGSFDLLADSSEVQVQKLISEIASAKHEKGSVGQKIADFYNTGMDTIKIESDGLSPIQPLFNEIDGIKSKEELLKELAHLHTIGINPMFLLTSDADQKNSEMVVAYLFQGGLGMPDRDYYMKDDERSKEIQQAYLVHLRNMFALIGIDENKAGADATLVYNLEKRLAGASMTRLEQRDPENMNKKKKIKDMHSERWRCRPSPPSVRSSPRRPSVR
jgi:putative endopeptidase